MRRRQFVALCTPPGLASLVACAHSPAPTPAGLWVDLRTGQPIAEADRLPLLRRQEHVLLGEQHDNPAHHSARGRILADLKPGCVVAEHLTVGHRVGAGFTLRARLEAAGFDARGWGWPLHESLFRPLIQGGVEVRGGNAPLAWVRSAGKNPEHPWPTDLPPDIRALLDAAPLSPGQREGLDRELMDGHCGKLPPERLPRLRLAQSLRDATMAQALLEAHAAHPAPVVLVAGNGHARRDHGVPHWLRAHRPHARVLSIGLLDNLDDAPEGAFDIAWVLPAVPRDAADDPCARI